LPQDLTSAQPAAAQAVIGALTARPPRPVAPPRARPRARLTPLLGPAYDPPDDERATRRWALGAFACL